MSNLSQDQLADLTAKVNERLDEFCKPLILPPLTPGVVRIAYDVIDEWRMESGKVEAKKWQLAYEDGYAAGLYDAAEIAAETAELEQAAAMDENGDPLAPADEDNELLTIAYGVGFERGKQVNAPVDDTQRLVTKSVPEPVDPELFTSAGNESANLVVGNPYYAEGNEEAVSKWPESPSNGHTPALSPQAVAPKRLVLPTLEELVAEVRRQAMGGVMPTMAAFDVARPASWATAQAHLLRLGLNWESLAKEAGLKLKRGANP